MNDTPQPYALLVGRTTINVEELALLYGVSTDSIYDAIRRGEVPHVRVGRRVLIPASPIRRSLGIEEVL